MSLLRTLLAICQRSWEPSFWEFESEPSFSYFISIFKFDSFKNPFTTNVWTLHYIQKMILLVQTKISDFYELWQQHKQLKIIEMSEAWPDTFDEEYIYINSNLNSLTKFTSSSRSTEFKGELKILPWNVSQMITKTVPIVTRTSISNAMKRGIPLWIWWKANGNWDNNMIRIFQWRQSHWRANTGVRRKK